MSEAITPVSRLGLLVGQPVVVSSAFLEGKITPYAVSCAASNTVGMVEVSYSAVRGYAYPTVHQVSSARTLESFAREHCGIEIIGRITMISSVEWPRRDAGAQTQVTLGLPEGMVFDDVYPGIREYNVVSQAAEPYVTYILGHIDAPVGPEMARARVESIKDHYGQLLSDVVYRIENSALFDNAIAETKEFQLLLLHWEDGVGRLAPGELDALSRELQLAFDAARQHAEALGLKHLPWTARRTARQAVKAAHLAASATTDGEREAARAKVAHLLGSLALYYLPTPDQSTRMLGAQTAQLDGGAV
ncbi:hypothetical protein [Tessaracoccus massiliensis]|uniref:hypothetical protein n=1 Tax=Tessaracoccus massiliensis TaxID=1522311 RepID=UPI00058B26C0|nr:hypothetical protein [Tessaracoccus massiliensis]